MADDNDLLQITPLGAGQEVGRSCIMLRYKRKNIMLDCGIHPAHKGMPALPYFDVIEPADVDVVLISHFHLDHLGALPYFTEKTKFKGKVYMTHATKAIGLLLIKDFVRVSNLSVDDTLFTESDLTKCFEKIIAVDFHQVIELEGLKFSCHHAGHVLGGAMFNIEIAGVKILYTGDYSREEDRHLPAAELPTSRPDILICESTYGKQSLEPLQTREARFTRLISDIISRGGRCLLPVFASGRAQELLLILDEFWEANPKLQSFPIYYASSLANKCIGVYQTYINMMNNKIRRNFPMVNPFKFKHIVDLKSIQEFDDVGPCVMMASPGMLQSGMSRELFEAWCTDPKNGVIIAGYSVEGTLAKHILSNPDDIMTMDGKKLPLRMSVDYISFSAHVDYDQNSSYIKQVNPPLLVLVHGDQYEMMRLKTSVLLEYQELQKNIEIFTPKNTETVSFRFKGERIAKLIGLLASEKPSPDTIVEGIAVTKDFQTSIMHKADLINFTDVTTSIITETVIVAYRMGSAALLQYHLELMFQSVQPLRDVPTGWLVLDAVKVIMQGQEGVILEWQANALNDTIVDAVLATILQIESVPASVKALQTLHDLEEGRPAAALLPAEPLISPSASTTVKREKRTLSEHTGETAFKDLVEQRSSQRQQQALKAIDEGLKSHFTNVSTDWQSSTITLEIDGEHASISADYKVTCDNPDLAARIRSVVHRLSVAANPFPLIV